MEILMAEDMAGLASDVPTWNPR